MRTKKSESRLKSGLGSKLYLDRFGKSYTYRLVCVFCLLFASYSIFVSESITQSLRSYILDIRYKLSHNIELVIEFCKNALAMVSIDSVERYSILERENILLKTTIAHLSQQLQDSNYIKYLGDANKIGQRNVIGRVVNIIDSDYTSSIIVNVGSSNNIEKNDFAINESGLVGRVIDIGEDWCEVSLTTNKSTHIPVKFASNKQMAIVRGSGNGNIEVTMKNQPFEIKEGELVVTSGYGGLYIEGIRVGTVQNGVIKPCFDKSNIRFVCIVGHTPF